MFGYRYDSFNRVKKKKNYLVYPFLSTIFWILAIRILYLISLYRHYTPFSNSSLVQFFHLLLSFVPFPSGFFHTHFFSSPFSFNSNVSPFSFLCSFCLEKSNFLSLKQSFTINKKKISKRHHLKVYQNSLKRFFVVASQDTD